MFWNKKTIWNLTVVLMAVAGLLVSGGGSAKADFTFGTPTNLGPTVNSAAWVGGSSISADGLTFYFQSKRPGGFGGYYGDIWVTTRDTKDDEWGTPMNLGPTINTSSNDGAPSISADGLSLYFSSDRPGGYGQGDLYVTTRATKDDDWSAPMNLGPTLNSSAWEYAPSLSGDGLTLYFSSDRPGGVGGFDLWQVSILPVVDFNGDGIVDCIDICLLVDYWGTDEPLYDIGPTPFGDGIVDVQDLLVLLEHLTKEAGDPNVVGP